MGTILGNKEYSEDFDEPIFGQNIRKESEGAIFIDNSKVDVGLLRDCWSAACAAGHTHFPSLNKMQEEFEKWMDEKKIDWRNNL